MNEPLAAMSSLVRFAPDFLIDSELLKLLVLCRASTNASDLRTLFQKRCFDRGFAHETVEVVNHPMQLPIRWTSLYGLHMRAKPQQDTASCFVLVCGVLIAIPISGIPLDKVVEYLNSKLIRILDAEFVLYHMLADGSVGPECFSGQSGSRFVAVLKSAPPTHRRSLSRPSTSRRKRSRSFEYPSLPLLPRSADIGSASGFRGRMILRESSDVHGWYKHSLFRSHSIESERQIRKTNATKKTTTINHQVMTLFLTTCPVDASLGTSGGTTGQVDNRWTLPRPTVSTQPSLSSQQSQQPPSSGISTLFPIHTPLSFDYSLLALKTPVATTSTPPQTTSYPPSRDLTPTLMSMIQELINRHIISEGTGGSEDDSTSSVAPQIISSAAEMGGSETVLSRAIRHMAIQFDSLSTLPHQQSNLSREELRRKYSPLNGYNLARSVALSEISKHYLTDQSAAAIEEIMRLAESQGVRDRPLLVQLQRGQWSRLAPKKFKIAAYMLGPPPSLIPLPEESRGEHARNRLVGEFSQKFFLGRFSWTVRVKFVPIDNPIVDQGGIVISSWRSLLDTETLTVITVDRDSSAENIFTQLMKLIRLKMDIPIVKDAVFTGSLTDQLRWCSSDFIEMKLVREESELKILVSRNKSDIVQLGDKEDGSLEGKKGDEQQLERGGGGGGGGLMLWDLVDRWDSNSTRNRISQWTSGNRSVEETVSDSSINRRRRLMERIGTSGDRDSSRIVRDEMTELGVDTTTEYSRWWLQSSEDEGVAESLLVRKVSAPQIDIERPRDEMSKDEVEGAKGGEVGRRPTTPTSPITRPHRMSLLDDSIDPLLSSEKDDPKILRSSKDTRQFEFHPYDPNLILAGSRTGVVSLIDSERDFVLSASRIDSSPILGIAWMRSHMNMALYGASSSGLVGYLKADSEGIVHQPVGRFMNLSSVSINCTDDYFVVSGFSRDVSLFDAYTGRKMSDLRDIHANFINIIRFSHYSPHVFATSSFDCSCKLWDLRTTRQGGAAAQPVSVYTTPTLNVMCCFSPLDESLLVSGLDGHVVQLSTRKGLHPNLSSEQLAKSIPSRNSTTNYRRSVYLADGENFITSGTDENFMRVIDSKTAQSKGVCRFDNLLDTFESRIQQLPAKPKLETEVPDTSSWLNYDASVQGSQLPGRSSTEYVQSLRGHPVYPTEVGVLLYPFDRSRSSYICMTRIPKFN